MSKKKMVSVAKLELVMNGWRNMSEIALRETMEDIELLIKRDKKELEALQRRVVKRTAKEAETGAAEALSDLLKL